VLLLVDEFSHLVLHLFHLFLQEVSLPLLQLRLVLIDSLLVLGLLLLDAMLLFYRFYLFLRGSILLLLFSLELEITLRLGLA
jgi:hypothetical protein